MIVDGGSATSGAGVAAPRRVLVSAWAPWCGACRTMRPLVDASAADRGVEVVDVRVDLDHELVTRYRVRSVPTLIAERDGVEFGRLVGLQPAASIDSLVGLVVADGEPLRRQVATELVALRAASGGALVVGGLLLGAAPLVAIGAALVVWAGFGLVRRWPAR